MKKIILFATIVLLAVSSSAQVKLSRTFDEKKEIKEINFHPDWYIRAGVNVNFINGSIDNTSNYKYSINAKVGFDVSTGFDHYFGKSPAYWGVDLGLASRGIGTTIEQIKNNDLTDKSYSYSIYAKLMPTIGVKKNVSTDFKLDAHFGWFFSRDFSNMTDDHQFNDNYGHVDIDPFDSGFQLGVGLWYKKYNIDLAWQQSVLEGVYVSGLGSRSLSTLMIRLGYEF